MDPIYEKLFDGYASDILKESENYDEAEIFALLDGCALDKKARLKLEDAFYDHYLRWSVDAFAVGLHLGLSLLHDQVRRLRPQ